MIPGPNTTDPRPLGRTGLQVSPMIVGTGRWCIRDGGVGPTWEETLRLVERMAGDQIITTIDTSNNYGRGESEHRIGRALAALADARTGLWVQTKADRDRENRFTGDQMRRSLEESMTRLGLDHLPMVYLHDPHTTTWDEAHARGGPVEALLSAQAEGLIGALGVAGSPPELMARYVDTGRYQAVITHNRFTLADRAAEPLIEHAHRLGVAVINAAPYGGKILTAWPLTTTRYAYGEATPEHLQRISAIAALCEQFDLPLGAAALQWSLRDPRLTATIVGLERLSEYEGTLAWSRLAIPDEFWTAVEEIG